jgi:chloride channel protein, CIC family
MGAACNVPLGGAFFALEALLGTMKLPLVPPALAASFIATAVSWLMLARGATAGHLGHRFRPGRRTGLGGLRPADRAGRPRQTTTQPCSYPARRLLRAARLRLDPLSAVTGQRQGCRLARLHRRHHHPAAGSTLNPETAGYGRCLGSGAPGGLFTPITYGALLGALLGQARSLLWPGATPGSHAIIGAAAVLAAAMQAPIAALMLMLELTHHIFTAGPGVRPSRGPRKIGKGAFRRPSRG